MRICDRTWARDKKAVRADYTIVLDDQEFNLCTEEMHALLQWVVNPTRGDGVLERAQDSVTRAAEGAKRKVLGLAKNRQQPAPAPD